MLSTCTYTIFPTTYEKTDDIITRNHTGTLEETLDSTAAALANGEEACSLMKKNMQLYRSVGFVLYEEILCMNQTEATSRGILENKTMTLKKRGVSMQQIVHTWVPHKELTHYIAIDQWKQDLDRLGLTFYLCKKDSYYGTEFDDKTATFLFDSPVAVRYSDEGMRTDLIDARFVDKEGVARDRVWPYFIVEHAHFTDWQKQYGTIGDGSDVVCYGLTEQHYLIEVISYTPPVVTIGRKEPE
ncbi:UNVERIFIED_CONTAM: hypothetical protein N8J90_15065 [Halobacillus marinus]